MKKVQLRLILLFSIVFNTTQAQQTILSAGGNATGTGGTVSYSIGQVHYITATGTNGSVSQGIQQSFEITTLSGEEFTQILLQMIVYPNPTSSYVNLKIENYDFQDLNYQLFDISGKQILSRKIITSETKIDLERLSKNIYLLQVTDKNKAIKTFKIIKNNSL